ncbi:MAG: HAMP domain-containing protein [Oscillospiraceae bacterium]|nr:HAMP domain-containing protein [Oscillospiraceae bacterium]
MKKVMDQSKQIHLLNGISLCAMVVMLLLLVYLNSVTNRLNEANEARFALTYNANRFMNGSSCLTDEVRAYAATGRAEHYENYWNEINVAKNRDQGVAAMQAIGITAREQAMIDAMSALSNQLVPLEEAAMENVQRGRLSAALDSVYSTEYDDAVSQISGLKEEFLAALDSRTQASIDALGRQRIIINALSIIAVAVAGLMQVYSMLFTKRKILHPVLTVRDQMVEISSGNLSASFPLEPDTSEIGMLVSSIHETKRKLKQYIQDIDRTLSQMAAGRMDVSVGNDYAGEFQPIQRAMTQILQSLNTALAQINSTAFALNEESSRLASDAQILSSGASDQAFTVAELSENIQKLSEQVNRTSADASSARQCSSDTENQLQLCSKKMRELNGAMDAIARSSQQISGITATIENISFQTNILALNAAVEAARAGSAGKGFAVVADEVQSLANKSTLAAKEITNLIQESIRLVSQGTALSADTAAALDGGVAGAKQSMELVAGIARSADEQAADLVRLTAGMDQISDVVKTTAGTAEKSAAAAQQLQGQAQRLKDSTQQFRLRKN